MDLFDQRAIADDGAGDYGLSGDMKKTQYVLQLLGAPYCAETLKCILIAKAARGVRVLQGPQATGQGAQYSRGCPFTAKPSGGAVKGQASRTLSPS